MDGFLTEDVVGIVHAFSVPGNKHGAVEAHFTDKHVGTVNVAQITRVIRVLYARTKTEKIKKLVGMNYASCQSSILRHTTDTYGDEQENNILEEGLERVSKDEAEGDEEGTDGEHVLDDTGAKDR